jgi:TonB family protein
MKRMAGSPASFHFATWQPRRERALSSFLMSLSVHAGVVAAIWTINPHVRPRQFNAPTITQILVNEDRQITWYAPKTAMPAVSPAEEPETKAEAKTPRYEAPQPVQATAPSPESNRQLIVSDRPEIRFEQDQELPNMLSWQAPKVELPRGQLVAPRLQPPPEPKKVEPKPVPPPREPAANAGLDVSRFEQIARLRNRSREPEPAPKPIKPPEPPKIAETPPAAKVDASQFQQLSRLRYQQQEALRQAPAEKALGADDVPEIATPKDPALDASQFNRLERLRYQQREQTKEAPRRQALAAEDAPTLREEPGTPGIDASRFQELSRLRYQAGDRGQARPEPARRALGADSPAPEIDGGPNAGGVDAATLREVPRLRYQGPARDAAPAPSAHALGDVAREEAPAVSSSAAESSGGIEVAKLDLPDAPPPSLGAPGGEHTGGTGGPVNMVVAGVKPANTVPLELPRGSRSGAFSAGPNATADGGKTAAAGTLAHLRAPNLSVQGPPAGTNDPGDALRALTRSGGFEQFRPDDAPKLAPNQDQPAKIDPETPFVGRPVYTLAINMPNVTSYRGDWVIQFAEALSKDQREHETEAERTARLAKKDGSLTPPYPMVKVDPKYSPDAVREKVEGEVILYCIIRETGAMTDLQLVESLDKRLDANAREAFAKWKFEPARKNGKPIAVETLIRIPFRLNPDIKIRY